IRDRDWYDAHVKAHEYAGLTAGAREIRSYGCPVLLSAPFTGQIRSVERWASWVEALGGPLVTLVYVMSDADTLRARLISRGSSRDTEKLASFDAFLKRMTPEVPPPVPHLLLDNRGGCGESLAAQVSRLVEEYGEEYGEEKEE
ncbi:AAA family ATPase, partial [Actinospica durhamensis]